MAEIKIIEDSERVTFALMGSLQGPEVSEFARIWESKRATTYNKRFQVDLSQVSSVDYLGKEMLAVMHGYGVELLSTGPMMSAVIDEILSCEHGELAHH